MIIKHSIKYSVLDKSSGVAKGGTNGQLPISFGDFPIVTFITMVGWSTTICIRNNNLTHIKKQILRSRRQHVFKYKGNKQNILVAAKLLLNMRDIVSPYAIGSSCFKLLGLRVRAFI
ncbi:unnamed protein product [Rotaria socialis]